MSTQMSLHRQIGLVPQDSFLFSGTLADNIRFGRPGATDEEVEQAARLANAHDFISALPARLPDRTCWKARPTCRWGSAS